VVAVSPADYAAEGFLGPLAGLAWQRKWEAEAFRMGGGGYVAPAQRISAYLAGRPGAPSPRARRNGLRVRHLRGDRRRRALGRVGEAASPARRSRSRERALALTVRR